MMGITKSDADKLTLWEYEAILWHHNEAHSSGSNDGIEAPDPETAMPILEMLNADPRFTHG